MSTLTGRQDFILRMAQLAEDEPEQFHQGDDLVTRTIHYAGSARPRVTRSEVEEALRLGGKGNAQ